MWQSRVVSRIAHAISLPSVLVCVGCVLAALAWASHITNRLVLEEHNRLLATRRYPYLLRGVKVDLRDHVRSMAPEKPLGPSPTLLMAFSDQCSACKRNLPIWQELTMSLASQRNQHSQLTFHLLSVLPVFDLVRPIMSQLARGNYDYRVSVIRSDVSIGAATGIVAVPMTALLSGDGSLVFTKTGVLDQRDVEMFVLAYRRLTDDGLAVDGGSQ